MRMLALSGRLAASGIGIGVTTAGLLRLGQTNPTTAALTYLIVILVIATGWGLAPSTLASLVAVLCFNFYFLPPVGTWTIADPQNWLAFVVFLVTAVVTSQLSSRARQRHIDALDRQRDLERLYALSRSLLLSEHAGAAFSHVAQRIAETFELAAVAIYDARADTVSRGGHTDIVDVEARLRDVARQAVSVHDDSGVTITAIRLGGAPIGSLAMAGRPLGDTVLQSVANLVAIAFERDRGRQAAALADAAQRSGELRAAVLDALAHDFKTPLTSLKVAVSDLQSLPARPPRDQELLAIVDEEVTRLQHLVTDVVQMLRIDAGDFVVRRDRHLVADIVRATVAHMGRRLEGHQVVTRVPDTLAVNADAGLLGLALRQLIDNAIKYSRPSSTIEVEATGNGTVTLRVRNSGSVIPPIELERIVDRFYRGSTAGQVPGTGIGLSIVQQIARAHGGSLHVTSGAEAGTTVAVSIPGDGR